MSDWFLSLKPAPPWSNYPFGQPGLVLVAIALILLTVFTYRRNPAATPGRIAVILALRLIALLISLAVAVRPSVGIQEDPRIPSTLLVGIDLSESMTIRDEFDGKSRIDAVRKMLEKCEPILDTLRNDQQVNVVFYQFGNVDFSEPAAAYDPTAPAAFRRSDYGIYLQRNFDKWQNERFVRAHLLIGDGADNGTAAGGEAEAARWRAVAPIHTFLVGKSTTRPDGKDVAVVGVSADPSPVPIKNDVTLKITINAFGFQNQKVPVIVYFQRGTEEPKQMAKQEITLRKEIGNELSITVKAPDTPGELKVRVVIPKESVPGDINEANNTLETFLTVTKEGVRLLLIDRDRFEHTFLRDVLSSEKRFDITDVVRQRDEPTGPQERACFDFASKHYDAIVIGNVSAKQIRAIDPNLPALIAKQVKEKGTGLILLGGDASYGGTGPLDTGWTGTEIEALLPVLLSAPPGVPPTVFQGDDKRFQTLPTERGLQYLMKVGPTEEASKDLWNKLNLFESRSRMTAIARLGDPKPGAVVYATSSNGNGRPNDPIGLRPNQVKAPWMLVGWEIEGGGKGRVLAFAGYDTYLWRAYGRRATPPTRDGFEIHAQFWRRVMLWLAKQDDADGAAYAKPEFRRLPIHGKQSIAVGLRSPEGVEIPNPTFDLRVVLPGQTPEQATPRTPQPDAEGKFKLPFDPTLPGEYEVILKASGKDSAGKVVEGEAKARFISFPEASDELLRAAADPDYLERLARASGGQPHLLDDLPRFLGEIQGQPLLTAKKPRYIPDWRRNHSHGFLPSLVVAFALILGLEWGLRRMWGLA